MAEKGYRISRDDTTAVLSIADLAEHGGMVTGSEEVVPRDGLSCHFPAESPAV